MENERVFCLVTVENMQHLIQISKTYLNAAEGVVAQDRDKFTQTQIEHEGELSEINAALGDA